MGIGYEVGQTGSGGVLYQLGLILLRNQIGDIALA